MRLWKLWIVLIVTSALCVPLGMTLGMASSGAATLAPCRTGALRPSIGRGSAAAGTAYVTLRITNIVKSTNFSSGRCTLSGTPTTQFGTVTADAVLTEFHGIGPTSTRLTIAGRGTTITLKSGAVASVTVGIETARNFPPSKCHKANVSTIRLVFHGGATLYYAPPRTFVCTSLASTTTSGVVLGTHYP
jgi:Protein of unknown function (DUF4232)